MSVERPMTQGSLGAGARMPWPASAGAGGMTGIVVGDLSDLSDLAETKAALENRVRELEALKQRLEAETVILQPPVRDTQTFDELVGRSASLGCVLEQVERVAPTNAPVLLLGETGTGKDWSRAPSTSAAAAARGHS